MVYNKLCHKEIDWGKAMKQLLIALVAVVLCITAHAQTTDDSTNTTCVNPTLHWSSTGGLYEQKYQTYTNACTTLDACNNLAAFYCPDGNDTENCIDAPCCESQAVGVCCEAITSNECENCVDGNYYQVRQLGILKLAQKSYCVGNQKLDQIQNKRYDAEMTFLNKAQDVKDQCDNNDCQTKVEQEITDLQNKCESDNTACSQDKLKIENDASTLKEDKQKVETTVKGDIQEEKSN